MTNTLTPKHCDECPHLAKLLHEVQREEWGIDELRTSKGLRLVVLMPTYNKEDTLARAIESVLMQKADFPYKLIILDDGSTDASRTIAEQYRAIHPEKIGIVRNQKNVKLLRSIYYGYTLLKGVDYFCVLDADDEYTSDQKLAKAVSYLDTHPLCSMYLTNILLRKGDETYPIYQGNEATLDFDYKDRKRGWTPFIQTSGVVYRNIYFKDGCNQAYDKIFTYKTPEVFRADGFRHEWYLKGGKAHFENRIESVYNLTDSGIWAGQTEPEQYIALIGQFLSFAQFFEDEKEFYHREAARTFKYVMNTYAEAIPHLPQASKDKLLEGLRHVWDWLPEPPPPLTRRIKRVLIAIVPIKSWRKKLRRKYL